MSEIFNKMYELSSRLYLDIAKNSREIEGDMLKKYPWTNRIFRSDRFRRAHLEVLDVRDTKKMWIMHICIFPHLDDSSPIFGFDVICGANKITGVFLDFSRADESHPMNIWFKEKTRNLVWKKDRELPDWGQRIFSPNMISAGDYFAPFAEDFGDPTTCEEYVDSALADMPLSNFVVHLIIALMVSWQKN